MLLIVRQRDGVGMPVVFVSEEGTGEKVEDQAGISAPFADQRVEYI